MGRALGGTLAVAALLLAACGTDTSPTSASDATTSPSPETSETSPGTPSASPSDSPSESPSASAESPSPAPAPDGPPFPESTDPQTAEPSGEWDLQLVDVRVGEHDGFNRVVLELSGTATPGWGVAWSDEAVAEGSGDVVPLEGDERPFRVFTLTDPPRLVVDIAG